MKLLAAVTSLALAAPGAAQVLPGGTPDGTAAPGLPLSIVGTYVACRGGAFAPKGADMEGFDRGGDVEVAFGAWLNRSIAIEAGVGYYKTTGRVDSPGGFVGVTARGKLSAVPLTASVRAAGQLGPAIFSAIAGVGLHLANMEIRYDSIYLRDLTGDDEAFGYHVGAGVAFQLSSRLTFGVDLRRTFVAAEFAGVQGNIDGLRAGAALAFRL